MNATSNNTGIIATTPQDPTLLGCSINVNALLFSPSGFNLHTVCCYAILTVQIYNRFPRRSGRLGANHFPIAHTMSPPFWAYLALNSTLGQSAIALPYVVGFNTIKTVWLSSSVRFT